MKKQKFTLLNRITSFKHALNGLRILILEEYNARIHFFAAVVILLSGILFKLSLIEWVGIFLSIGLVISLEIINTSVENLADFVYPERHEKIKKIKDLSAAAVLVAALMALMVGLVIFAPKIYKLF